MTCPHCKSATEMVFSVLSHGFVCQEADCGLELEFDREDLVALLGIQPVEAEPELLYA